MIYCLQLMRNRWGFGGNRALERSIQVESEDIPRKGDLLNVRGRGFAFEYHAKVYECFRNISGTDMNPSGSYKFSQDIPLIRAVIRERIKL